MTRHEPGLQLVVELCEVWISPSAAMVRRLRPRQAGVFTFAGDAIFGILLSLVLASASTAQSEVGDPDLPSYNVLRTSEPIRIDGKLDEHAWFAAPTCGPFRFTWYKEGDKEQTVVKMLWDDANLYIAHVCQDAHITARHKQHDDPIAEDDCFEIMLAPNAEKKDFYFNIEWNLHGGYVDGHRPDGPTGPRKPWDVEGLRVASSHAGTLNDDTDRDRYWAVEVAIPLKNFAPFMPHMPPEPGDRWRVNFNRHGGDTNMQYSQWSSGDTLTPAFHTPHRFGLVTFSSESSPY